jgi:hypothetical protein
MDYKTLYEQSQKENEQLKLWKSIARQKTEALQHCFPSYNPAFQACDDKEEIIKMIEALKKKGREYKQKYEETLETDMKYEEQIEELKKENEQLKNMERYSNCLCRFFDPSDNGDIPDKEHIDSFCDEFGYDDKIKKQLYQDFWVDEDEE